MHICVTHVDARTGIPCDVAPMRKGPAFPNVKGLSIQWFNQSEWPTDKPLFYGTCDDDADLNVAGIVSVLSEQEYTMFWGVEEDTRINQIRTKRNSLLSDSDWRVIKAQETSTPMSQAWLDYRQALRDITDHANFPWLDETDWPAQPG